MVGGGKGEQVGASTRWGGRGAFVYSNGIATVVLSHPVDLKKKRKKKPNSIAGGHGTP